MKPHGRTSRGEFRAVIALACILAAGILFPRVLDYFHPHDEIHLPAVTTIRPVENPATEAPNQVRPSSRAKFRGQRDATNSEPFSSDQAGDKRYPSNGMRRAEIRCQLFDPNAISEDTMIAMGLKPFIARNIYRYREAGGRFRTPEDLNKIYGMDSLTYRALRDCIQIEDPENVLHTAWRASPLDINTAGIEDWKSLPGIGEVFADRIMKFRDRLGGFHSVEQVGETYGLPPGTMARIAGNLTITSPPRRINLNTATVEELDAHPYISRRQAETIVNYRNNHGSFAQVEEVMKIYSLNPDWLHRMRPYLTCQADIDSGSEFVVR